MPPPVQNTHAISNEYPAICSGYGTIHDRYLAFGLIVGRKVSFTAPHRLCRRTAPCFAWPAAVYLTRGRASRVRRRGRSTILRNVA